MDWREDPEKKTKAETSNDTAEVWDLEKDEEQLEKMRERWEKEESERSLEKRQEIAWRRKRYLLKV